MNIYLFRTVRSIDGKTIIKLNMDLKVEASTCLDDNKVFTENQSPLNYSPAHILCTLELALKVPATQEVRSDLHCH